MHFYQSSHTYVLNTLMLRNNHLHWSHEQKSPHRLITLSHTVWFEGDHMLCRRTQHTISQHTKTTLVYATIYPRILALAISLSSPVLHTQSDPCDRLTSLGGKCFTILRSRLARYTSTSNSLFHDRKHVVIHLRVPNYAYLLLTRAILAPKRFVDLAGFLALLYFLSAATITQKVRK